MTARYLFVDMHVSISDETKIIGAGLPTFDYWAGQAMQRAIPILFSGISGRIIPGARYKNNGKGRFTAMQPFADFGSDTDKSSVYKKILDAIQLAEYLLLNHINNALASGSMAIRRVCKHMLQR